MFESGRSNWLGQGIGLGGGFVEACAGSDPYSKLSRYETALERALFRSLHELQRLQASRSGAPVPLPMAIDMDIPEAPTTEA